MAEIVVIEDKNFEIRRNPRRKNISAGIDSHGVYFIACPSSCTVQNIRDIIVKEADKFTSLLKRNSGKISEIHKYRNGEKFFFRGAEYPLEWTDSDIAPALEMRDGKFFISARAAGIEYSVFESWYKRALYEDLREMLQCWTKILRVNPCAVRIKTVKSVWGSCSAKGSLTFCTRLALIGPELLKYVIVHELCHFMYMNHSAQFWGEVAKYIPDYREKKSLLNKNAHIYKWW